MTRLIWPIVSLFALALVASMPTSARPALSYDASLLSRSLELYVYDASGPIAEEVVVTTTEGTYVDARGRSGFNTGNPWDIVSFQSTTIDSLSITGSGGANFSQNNDDKTQIGLLSNLYAEFTIDEAAAYTFDSASSGDAFVQFVDLLTGLPMAPAGMLVPGRTYLMFAQATVFEFSPSPTLAPVSAWFINFEVVPTPGVLTLATLGVWIGTTRRRCVS